MRLYLVRHPQVESHREICYGQLDLACEPGWRPQLAQSARLLPDPGQVLTVSSPLQRCRLVAEAWLEASATATPTFENDLKELSFGEWEGRPWRDIDRAALDEWARDKTGFAAPGGESLLTFSRRVNAVIDRWMTDDDRDRVVFTHSGVIRMMVVRVLGMPLANSLRMEVDHLSVSAFDLNRDRAKMLFLNRL